MRRRYPTERETDELLVRKLQPARRPGLRAGHALHELCRRPAAAARRAASTAPFEVSNARWFTGGASKIQMGFDLHWDDPARGPSHDRMMLRMDPAESHNATSRKRELELLQAFDGVLPVPPAYWVDEDARYFPEPALIYGFVAGVTKPSATRSGQVSGMGTNFGPELRAKLAPQFMRHLAAIHTYDADRAAFDDDGPPAAPARTEGALWQLNRARRIWEEDRGDDLPLMEVAANWLERNLPALDRVSVVHGDYRSGNFLFDEDTAARSPAGWTGSAATSATATATSPGRRTPIVRPLRRGRRRTSSAGSCRSSPSTRSTSACRG